MVPDFWRYSQMLNVIKFESVENFFVEKNLKIFFSEAEMIPKQHLSSNFNKECLRGAGHRGPVVYCVTF